MILASECLSIDLGLPQGTGHGQLLFLLHINDITECLSSEIRLFVDDSILFRIIKSHKDHLLFQRGLDTLHE